MDIGRRRERDPKAEMDLDRPPLIDLLRRQIFERRERLLESTVDRGVMQAAIVGAMAGEMQIANRLFVGFRFQRVLRQALGPFADAFGVMFFDRPADRLVQRAPTRNREGLVRDRVRERVLESQHGAAGIFRLEQELTRLELVDLLVQQLVRACGDPQQQIPLHFGADDRGDLQQRAGTRRQPVHARRQHTLHRLREAESRSASLAADGRAARSASRPCRSAASTFLR